MSIFAKMLALSPFNEAAGCANLKRVRDSDVQLREGMLVIGDDHFKLSGIPYVTINRDPDSANGLAGAIEVLTKDFSGPDGVRILPHKYVVVGEGGSNLAALATALDKASIEVDSLSVNHGLFAEAFLGAPQIK